MTTAVHEVAALAAVNVDPPCLFELVKPTCKPVACHSCIYCKDDLAFIKSEVERLLSEGVMEPSRSPWGLKF